MNHTFEDVARSKCTTCGATQAEIDDNVATVECLGLAGYELRKQAVEAVVEARLKRLKAKELKETK